MFLKISLRNNENEFDPILSAVTIYPENKLYLTFIIDAHKANINLLKINSKELITDSFFVPPAFPVIKY